MNTNEIKTLNDSKETKSIKDTIDIKDNKDIKDIKDNKDKKDKKDLLIDIDDNYYCFNPSKILRKIEPYLIKKFKGDAK